MRSCYLHPPICAVPSLAYVHTRGWRQNLATQTHQGCQFICGTVVVKRKKSLVISYALRAYFLGHYSNQNLSPIAFLPMKILWLNSSPDSFACLQTYLQSYPKSSWDCCGNISLNWLLAVTPAWLLIERFVSLRIKEPEKDMSLNRVCACSPEHYVLIASFTFGKNSSTLVAELMSLKPLGFNLWLCICVYTSIDLDIHLYVHLHIHLSIIINIKYTIQQLEYGKVWTGTFSNKLMWKNYEIL